MLVLISVQVIRLLLIVFVCIGAVMNSFVGVKVSVSGCTTAFILYEIGWPGIPCCREFGVDSVLGLDLLNTQGSPDLFCVLSFPPSMSHLKVESLSAKEATLALPH